MIEKLQDYGWLWDGNSSRNVSPDGTLIARRAKGGMCYQWYSHSSPKIISIKCFDPLKVKSLLIVIDTIEEG